MLWLALYDDNVKLRAQFPEVFERVAAIQATRPTRLQGWSDTMRVVSLATAECRWCGDDFILTKPNSFYCSRDCYFEYQRWRNRRHHAG